MLDRAARYLRDASTIARAWATGFGTVSAGTVPAWPLGGQPRGPVNNLMEEGHARDQDKYKKLVRSALRNLRCAEEVSKKATIRERNKLRSRGRRFSNTALGGMPGGPIPQPLPQPIDPQGAQTAEFDPIDAEPAPIDAQTAEFQPIDTSLDDGELEDGDIVLDEEGEEEVGEEEIQEEPESAPAKKAKKKDNTLLIAGAAALGIMALKGR
jgi:TATA-binding protein-associated factor Taf7